jgi:hypothetical protein
MSRHKLTSRLPLALALTACVTPAVAADPPQERKAEGAMEKAEKAEGHKFEPFKPESVTSNGSVTVEGHAIAYEAVAGTLIVHPRGWDDVPTDPSAKGGGEEGAEKNPTA